jgi:DNA-binding MarR family transcriptional regulator
MNAEDSRFDGPEASPGFLLWHALLRWQRAMNAALDPFGLTHMQFVMLTSIWWIGRNEGVPPNQTELARWVGVDKMTTSQVVRNLESRKLVARVADPSDARAFKLTPTAKGAKLAGSAIASVEAVDEEFFGVAGDLPETTRLLRELADADWLAARS